MLRCLIDVSIPEDDKRSNIECGYNYLKHDFEFIKVNVDILENIVSENILEELLYQHQKYVLK